MRDIESAADLAGVLRRLRRRLARTAGDPELTYRQLAARTGWGHGAIADYFSGRTLPPTDRFDVLVRVLGATPEEQRELATARDLVADRRRRPSTVATAPVPMELPPDVYGFTGRTRQLDELDAIAGGRAPDGSADGRTVMPIAVVTGTAGVGKTALAVRWAHRAQERFPDGRLYLDLRGYDPGRPVSAGQALGSLLRSLGVAGSDVPVDLAGRAARLRSLLAGRKVLVLLDNAHSVEQVRPLLPGSPTCCVVVTSRDGLAGLVARDGARRVELDVLPDEDAVRLLATLIGPRVHEEPDAAAELVRRCARLPLALRVVAELVVARPGEPVGVLAREQQACLDLLDRHSGDDVRTGVRATFSWSLRHLPPEAVATFTALGLHPGRDFDTAAIQALTDDKADLDRLERAHLVQRTGRDRYQLHDLLRAYASELAEPDDAALRRLYDHYVHGATKAMDALYPVERGVPPKKADEAIRWLDAERANLMAIAHHAAEHHRADVCVALSWQLWRYLDSHGHYQDGLALHAEAAAATAPGSVEHARARGHQAMAHWRLGQCERSLPLLDEALAVHRRHGTKRDLARTLANLAIVCEQVGRYKDSREHHVEALALYRELGDRRREGSELGNLGVLHYRLDEHEQAIDCQQRAARIGAELGDVNLQGYAMANLGLVYQRQGRYPEALASHLRGLAYSRQYGDRRGEGEMLRILGVTYGRLGRFDEALRSLERALEITRELGNRVLEAESLNDLGEVRIAMAEPDEALSAFEHAHAVATWVGDPHEQARALEGQGEALHRSGREADAVRRRRAALRLYTELGLPAADRLRDRLTRELSPQHR